MSIFNLGSFVHSDLPVTSGKCEWGSEPRDPESGRLLKHLTKVQLDGIYTRFPHLREHNIEPYDPNRALPWDDCSTINGAPASLARKYDFLGRSAGLLKDPIETVHHRQPTKPVAKPEPPISLYRSSIHECGHVLTCFALDVPVARMSLIKEGDKLGHIKHADLPDSEEHLSILLGGRAAEFVEFNNERTAGCETDMQNARAMAKRLAGYGADVLIEKTLQRCVDMLRGEKNAVRYLAYELVNKRQLDFDEIDTAIDRAFSRSEQEAAAKVVPTKGRVSRTYNMNNPKDLADWNAKQGRAPDAEPIGYAPGYIARKMK